MRECLRCGGSAYRDYAYGCDHQFWDDVIPEPEVFLSDAPDAPAWWAEEFGAPCARSWGDNGGGGVACRGEQMHVAWAQLPDGRHYVTYHPTREGARQLWREQYAIGLMVDALFRKITGWAKEGSRLRAKREARAFDLRKLDVYVGGGNDQIPSFQQYASDEEVAEIESALARGVRMGSFSYPVREAVEEFTRKPYAVWCAEQGLDVVHDHAMSGTPKVPAGWPDNRTPEEKAAAALVGKRWVLGSKSWTVTRVHSGYPKLVVVAFFDKDTGHTSDPVYDPAHLLRTVREMGATEVTSE